MRTCKKSGWRRRQRRHRWASSSASSNRIGDTIHVDLWYPRAEAATAKFIQIGLVDVRAADDLRIRYDFDRDGWVVEQASRWEWEPDDTVCDPGWREAAFLQAWQFDEREKT